MDTEIATVADMQKKAPRPSERPVSARIAAEFLQMHVRSITRLAGVGHIPGHPVGYGQRKKWLFYISELDEWLRAQISSEASRRRQGIRRKSCLDETVISSEVSNFAKGPKARTYGYSVIGIDRNHLRYDPR
jgi:hypothetical protein